MDNIVAMQDELRRLRGENVDLKVDINIRDARIRELEEELRKANAKLRQNERETQTMQKLEILTSDDDTGISPYDTGIQKSPWERVR